MIQVSPAFHLHTFYILMCVCSVARSYLTLCDRWTVAWQAPLFMESSRQEYWSGGHLFLQGIFLSQGWSPHLLCLWQQADSLPLCNQVGPYIFIVNTNHVYALVWDFCPGLKYFVLTDTFTRPALREGLYYDLEWAVLLPQTQSPAHHSLSHQHARMEQRRRKSCGPGGHTCSPREVFPRMATGSLWFASHLVDRSTPRGISDSLTPLVLGWDVSREFYPQD